MLPWISAPRMARPVVDGCLVCPRGDAPMAVSACLGCPYLDEIVTGVDGAVTEITCAPCFGSFAARPLPSAWRSAERAGHR